MNQGPAKTKRYFTAAAANSLVDPSGAARLEDIRDFQNEIRLETIEEGLKIPSGQFLRNS